MTKHGHWATPSLEQMAELSMGVLPREFHNASELTPQAARIYAAGQKLWPTPDANSRYRDMSKVDPVAQKRADTHRTVGLHTQAIDLTPSLTGPHSPTTPTAGAPSFSGGPGWLRLCLNPLFVSWLMMGRSGIGWMCLGHPATATEATSCEPSGMASCPSKRVLPSVCSGAMSSARGREAAS
jgi:hypothetical protein